MEVTAYVINLAAKKLAGEATADELIELNRLLHENEALNNSLENTFVMWDKVNFGNPLSEQDIEQKLAIVLKKIHRKINPDDTLPNEPLKDC